MFKIFYQDTYCGSLLCKTKIQLESTKIVLKHPDNIFDNITNFYCTFTYMATLLELVPNKVASSVACSCFSL